MRIELPVWHLLHPCPLSVVAGREARLPLRIRGEGLGPNLVFSFDQLDIGKVFVGSSHSYEVSGCRPGEPCWIYRQAMYKPRANH